MTVVDVREYSTSTLHDLAAVRPLSFNLQLVGILPWRVDIVSDCGSDRETSLREGSTVEVERSYQQTWRVASLARYDTVDEVANSKVSKDFVRFVEAEDIGEVSVDCAHREDNASARRYRKT